MMTPENKEKLLINAGAAWKMWSNWIMTASGALGAVYLALPVDQQQTLIAHLPVPPWLLPIIGTAIGVVLRVIPQKNLTPVEAAAKSADPQPTAERDVK